MSGVYFGFPFFSPLYNARGRHQQSGTRSLRLGRGVQCSMQSNLVFLFALFIVERLESKRGSSETLNGLTGDGDWKLQSVVHPDIVREETNKMIGCYHDPGEVRKARALQRCAVPFDPLCMSTRREWLRPLAIRTWAAKQEFCQRKELWLTEEGVRCFCL